MSKQSPLSKPKASSSFAQKELDKAEQQFQKFDEQVKSMTMDRLNEAPKVETEQQTKISTREAQKDDGIWLKPVRSISSKEQFNEKYRSDYNFKKEYVKFIAEHKEIIGEKIEKWTKPFPGMPAEYWEIPPNKVVWGPRYLAEEIKKHCGYHRLTMQNHNVTSADGMGSYYGTLTVDSLVQRIDAIPVSERKSIFMGAEGF